MASGRMFKLAPVLLVILCAAACQSQPGPAARSDKTDTAAQSDKTGAAAPGGSSVVSVTREAAQQPRTATYSCAGGGSMTIENLGSSIHVVGADGTIDEELPASPANQNSRFGAEHDAVVIDGRDALIMKGGHTPVTCKR